jgi:hypothetical protein
MREHQRIQDNEVSGEQRPVVSPGDGAVLLDPRGVGEVHVVSGYRGPEHDCFQADHVFPARRQHLALLHAALLV